MLFLSLIAGVIGSLVVDMIVVFRSRVPYVSDSRLPGDEALSRIRFVTLRKLL